MAFNFLLLDDNKSELINLSWNIPKSAKTHINSIQIGDSTIEASQHIRNIGSTSKNRTISNSNIQISLVHIIPDRHKYHTFP